MAYKRFNRYQYNQTPRNITVKYAGTCICCGGTIKAGEFATFYPVGSVLGRSESAICHIGGLDGNSHHCADVMRTRIASIKEDRMVADYVSAGLGEF